MYVAEAAAPFARLAILILWMNSGDVLGECAVLRVYLSNPPSHEETITFLCWVLVFLLTAPHTIALLRRTSYFRSFSRSHACVEYQLTYTLLFWQEDTLSPVAGHEHKGWLVGGVPPMQSGPLYKHARPDLHARQSCYDTDPREYTLRMAGARLTCAICCALRCRGAFSGGYFDPGLGLI